MFITYIYTCLLYTYIHVYIYIYINIYIYKYIYIYKFKATKFRNVYILKENQKHIFLTNIHFSKDNSGEETSSKVPTNTPRVFHAETTRTRRFHVDSTSFQYGTHAMYL